jgi:hypothetical protein
LIFQLLESSDSSEAAFQALRTKLQVALRDGVSLLENVQQLESEKVLLQTQIEQIRLDLSRTVMSWFFTLRLTKRTCFYSFVAG